jgi:predicted AAA+ superfamily ATPase
MVGYFFATLALEAPSPLHWTARVDGFFIDIGRSVRARRQHAQRVRESGYESAKIFDIKTGEAVIGDSEFMDAMLEKISKYGEDALSRKERKRMDMISNGYSKK